MVNIPKRGADSYLMPADVEDGDYALIVKEPYVQTAENSKYGKERTIITVQVQRTKEIYRWSLNTTSNDRLVAVFGGDGDMWKGKQVKIRIQEQNVSGVNKSVLYAVPTVQTKVAPASPSD